MKQLKLFFALFAMLALNVGNAWGADVSVTWPKTTALSTTATNVDGDANVTIKISEANTYTNPLRFYAGKTTTIEVAEGYQLKSVAYEASSTGNYVTYAKDATVSPDVTPSVNSKIITWDLSGSNTKTFTFKPSSQTRCNGITITYTAASGETPGEGGGEDPDEPTLDPDEPETGGETWTLVTNASDLKAGDEVVIAATGSDYALGPQASNNRTAVAITKTGNNITWTTDVQIITLETGNKANTFAFNTGSGYLYAASSSNNYLKTKTNLDDNGSWAITITSEGVATIKAQGSYTRNWIRKNSSSAIFSCYGSGQSDVAIYKKVTSTDEPGSGETVVSLIPKNELF